MRWYSRNIFQYIPVEQKRHEKHKDDQWRRLKCHIFWFGSKFFFGLSSDRLQSEYHKKKVEYDRKELLVNKERQRESQEKFDADMRQFKTNGRLLQVQRSSK